MMRLTLFVICLLGLASTVTAQEGEGGEDVRQLDSVSRRMASHLASLPAFHVAISQDWTLLGKNKVEGRNNLKLAARHEGDFRLEVGTGRKEDALLICAGDGEKITRLWKSGNQAVHSIQEGGLEHLLHDRLTETSLHHTGLDLLCRRKPERYIMVMASKVKYLGERQLPSGRAHHFAMNWGDDEHRCEIWVAVGDEPLLVKTTRRLKLNLPSDDEAELSVTTHLDWQKVAQHPDDQLQVKVPDHSMEVADLHCHLSEGNTAKLLGKAAPVVDLKLLDGDAWKLPRGKIVVLYFFATWAVPSLHEKKALLELLSDHDKDVVLFAISVDPDAETVRAFVESKKYEHSVVLDPKQQATTAYGVTALPTIVVVGKDGTLQAVHVGNTDDIRAQLRSDLKRLRKGESRGAPKR